jgi:hypothetical protein
MRKLLCAAILMGFLLASSVFGQQDADLFVKSVPILKVLSHPLGYKVYYQKANADFGFFYVPVNWFRGAAGKGAIIWGNEADYPYFSIYWRNKEFFYIKLFLKEDMAHDTWGVLEADISDVKDKFDIETLKVEF